MRPRLALIKKGEYMNEDQRNLLEQLVTFVLNNGLTSQVKDELLVFDRINNFDTISTLNRVVRDVEY